MSPNTSQSFMTSLHLMILTQALLDKDANAEVAPELSLFLRGLSDSTDQALKKHPELLPLARRVSIAAASQHQADENHHAKKLVMAAMGADNSSQKLEEIETPLLEGESAQLFARKIIDFSLQQLNTKDVAKAAGVIYQEVLASANRNDVEWQKMRLTDYAVPIPLMNWGAAPVTITSQSDQELEDLFPKVAKQNADPVLSGIVRNAVYKMAAALQEQHFERTENFREPKADSARQIAARESKNQLNAELVSMPAIIAAYNSAAQIVQETQRSPEGDGINFYQSAANLMLQSIHHERDLHPFISCHGKTVMLPANCSYGRLLPQHKLELN
jgi:hypothetical protein